MLSSSTDADARTWPTPMGVLERGGDEHFVRDHLGAPAEVPDLLCVDGAVADPFEIFISDVRTLPAREELVVLECAGHRRDEYAPTANGVQWGAGAVGEARWRGTPLHALIRCARPHANAREVIFHGADGYARSLPFDKAISPEPLVVWEMNGAPLPHVHGAPLRVVVPGWYATDDVKWLTRIEVATTPFEGRFQMEEYRWIEPGDCGDGDRLTALPVHSLITSGQSGTPLRGVAWSDGSDVVRVEVRIDHGPWREAALTPPGERFGLTRWELAWDASPGWHLIESRATDKRGRAQPPRPLANQGGYANNAVHGVSVEVA